MPLQCPHCQSAIVIEGKLPGEIVCPSCGSSIEVDPEATRGALPHDLPKRLGKFEFLEQLGIGAFGTVYKARDTELGRIVALKIPRSGSVPKAEDLDRFLREAKSAAQLKHPSIVSLYDAGSIDGTCCLVSEFIQGSTLAQRLSAKRLGFRQAAELIAEVADALHYAHQHRVVHRDIKPSNIMLDLEGRPHLLDFGLAKRAADEITMTLEGQVLGTPAYMSPEQARGEVGRVDARSDLYSLGVILYELLTGELPFRGQTRMLLVQVIQDEPRPPRRLNDRIPRDLETICLKAMAKESARRYPTARDLADDLRRFLKGEPIQARPVGRVEKLWRWCRRKPAVAALSAGLLGLLLVLAIGGPLLALREASLADQEARARQDAQQAHVKEKRAHDKEQQARREAEQNLYVADVNLAQEAYEEGNVQRALALLEDHRHSAWRGFEWRYLWRLCQEGDALHTLRVHSGGVSAVAFSNGGLLATGDEGGAVKLWDAASKQEVAAFRHSSGVTSVTFSQDGELLAAAGSDGTVVVWHVGTRKEVGNFKHEQRIHELVFSADGKLLAASGGDRICLWDVATRQRLPDAKVESRFGIAFSPDNKTVACTTIGTTVHLWDVARQQVSAVLEALHSSNVFDIAFSPDGAILATGCWDTMIKLWDVQSLQDGQPQLLATLDGHRSSVNSLAFSPDGMLLASASRDHTVRLWSVGDKRESQLEPFVSLRGHTGPVRSVAFSPDGKLLASASADGTVKLWPGQGRRRADVLEGHTNWVWSVAFLPDDRTLASGSFGGSVRLWDAVTLEPKDVRQPHANDVFTVACSPDGKWFASCDAFWHAPGTTRKTTAPGQVKLRILSDLNQEVDLRGYTAGIRAVAFPPDSKSLATGDTNGELKLWDLGDLRQPILVTTVGQGRIEFMRFSPDGKTLAIIINGLLLLWSIEGQKAIKAFDAGGAGAGYGWGAAFSPDGKILASGGTAVKLWDTATLKELATLDGHKGPVMGLAFSPDGKTLATASLDHTVKLWSVEIGQEVATLKGHRGPVSGLAFSRDGTLLVSSSEDKTIRLWRAVSEETDRTAGN